MEVHRGEPELLAGADAVRENDVATGLMTRMTSAEKAADLDTKSYSNFKVTYHGDGGKTRTEIIKARRAYEAEAMAKRNLRSGEWGVTAERVYNAKGEAMTRLNCRETVRVGNAEDGKRPLINPKASAMKQDEQTRAQQKWDKEHGGKPAPKVNAIDPRTGRLNCREQNSDAAPLTGVNLKRLFESGKSNKEIVAEAKKRMERETKKPGCLNCREQNGGGQCEICGHVSLNTIHTEMVKGKKMRLCTTCGDKMTGRLDEYKKSWPQWMKDREQNGKK